MNVSIGASAIASKANEVLANLDILTNQIRGIKGVAVSLLQASPGGSEFLGELTVFLLACFVGYYVVWNVTPALHSPLMAVTNAISSVVIVGALIAVGSTGPLVTSVAFAAILLASVNIFGGFVITQRMLRMFKKKQTKACDPSE
ncbi:MAG: proton-translocating transhydrogenase family protein [Holosporales bacterium]|jgi:NAD(P) transhydrogenase subunit alpha|nr:proton-translocating transhydrogenase family protein [Holosporales bacterium]